MEFVGGTGVADAEPVFRQADIDHVIIGGGLEARAAMAGRYSSPAIGRRCA
jgi:hypothetical protein